MLFTVEVESDQKFFFLGVEELPELVQKQSGVLLIGGDPAGRFTAPNVVPVPSAVLQAMPFALTLLAVSGRLGRARAPAALG